MNQSVVHARFGLQVSQELFRFFEAILALGCSKAEGEGLTHSLSTFLKRKS